MDPTEPKDKHPEVLTHLRAISGGDSYTEI